MRLDHASLLDWADALLRRRQLSDAIACFYQAEQPGFDSNRCASGRWTAFMLSGQFVSAWEESDAIRHREGTDPRSSCQDTVLRDKRLIVRCLHGFGDTVQFLRFAPRLRALTSRLIIEVAPRMVDLARCIDGVQEVITWGPSQPDCTEWDMQVEVMELPYLFRITAGDLPIASNYVKPPAKKLCPPMGIVDSTPSPQIGVVWSCGNWNLSRSVPLQMLTPLLQQPDCCFWNLQGGPARTDWQKMRCHSMMCDAQELCDGGLLPLAVVISQLDLVITVDTLAAHLAGAMNIPVWVLLQHEADWRWMVGRDDSPWYPSMRLFRQSRPSSWAGTIADVEYAFGKWRTNVYRQRAA
jgi:hypothetical protein